MSTRYALERVSGALDHVASAENYLRDLRLGITDGDLDDSDLGDLEAMEHRLEEARRIGRTLTSVLARRLEEADQ